jgi:hypothetical protein
MQSGTAVRADDQDPAQVKLFRIQEGLARAGDPEGQYYLGEMYENGLGTPPDRQSALIWYQKSAAQGNAKAAAKLAKWKGEAQRDQERAAEAIRAAEAARLKQQADADAAAAARAKIQAAKAAESARAAEALRARQQAEADSAALARARAAIEASAKSFGTSPAPRTTPTLEPSPSPGAIDTPTPSGSNSSAKGESPSEDDATRFSVNPCKGPQAKFLSTCH